MSDPIAARMETTWALHAVAHAAQLVALDPTWGTQWFELADGWVVLQGPGLYVNRALALGLTTDITAGDLGRLETDAAVTGVEPGVDVTPASSPSLVELLHARGYQPTSSVGVMTMPLDDPSLSASVPAELATPSPFRVRPIADDELESWQRICILGWGHDTRERRRASDAYAAAAHATPGETLLIAFDPSDDRPVGVASLAVRDRLATLGGMSTVPSERGRGVQRALVAERLHHARAQGCDLAACSAVSGGDSERNLRRLGFSPRYVKTTWTRP